MAKKVTGFPPVPEEGMYWEVQYASWGEEYLPPYPMVVKLMRPGKWLWFKTIGLVGSEYSGDTEEALYAAALKVLENYATGLRRAALVGKYPPKTLEEA
jgi:hypothetical protein